MIEVTYAPTFLKEFNKLDAQIQDLVEKKISLFVNSPRNISLRIHKLKGELKGRFSFSVTYKYRVIFSWLSKTQALFLSVGTHAIYK